MAEPRVDKIPFPEALAALILAFTGLAVSLAVLWPGVATFDAISVYEQSEAGLFSDWQPPVFGVLWRGLEPIFGDGPPAIIVPTLGLYWLSFLLLFYGLRRRGSRRAWLALLAPFLPPLIAIQGIVWRDVVFAMLWASAFALTLLARPSPSALRRLVLSAGLLLLAAGFLLRPNALFAAIPLTGYILWPDCFRLKRLILIALPLIITLQLLNHTVNYVWLDAKKLAPIHSIMVFDLAGISHFEGMNLYPVSDWSPEAARRAAGECYDPRYWDAVWWMRQECSFIMKRLDLRSPGSPPLFGSALLREAWVSAILNHPVSYLRHRLAHFQALMFDRTMVTFDRTWQRESRFPAPQSPAYHAFMAAIQALAAATPLFLGWPWLALTLALCIIGWRRAATPAGAALSALALSGSIYTLTYLPLGVAAEYRYLYWTVWCGLAGCVVLLATPAAAPAGQLLQEIPE